MPITFIGNSTITVSTAGSSSITVSYPAGIQANDILVLQTLQRSTALNGIHTYPGTFTFGSTLRQAGVEQSWGWRRATSTETGSTSVTVGPNQLNGWTKAGIMGIFRSVRTDGNPHSTFSSTAALSTLVNPAASTATSTTAMVVALHTFGTTSFSTIYTNSTRVGTSSRAWEEQVVPGQGLTGNVGAWFAQVTSTGTIDIGQSTRAQGDWVAYAIVLEEAAAFAGLGRCTLPLLGIGG